SMENNKGNDQAKDQFEQTIVPRSAWEVEVVPMACESGTDQIMQLQLNVPLKKPLQHLHDLATHNVTQVEEDILRQNPMEDEGDDESTAGNFKQVAREADLSLTTSPKGGKKTKKNQNKEPLPPSRIVPSRAASKCKL
ncbi:hypothetical protein A4A49_56549, partial [Nicotiana attenuata]